MMREHGLSTPFSSFVEKETGGTGDHPARAEKFMSPSIHRIDQSVEAKERARTRRSNIHARERDPESRVRKEKKPARK